MFEIYQTEPSRFKRFSNRARPYYRPVVVWAKETCRRYPLPVICTIIIGLEIAAALCFREGGWLFKLLHRHGWPNIDNYAAKWEFFALTAAFLLVIVYMWFLHKAREDFPGKLGWYHFGALVVLFLSLAALGHALNTLEKTVDSHVFAVFLVSALFSVGDFCTWRGIDPQKQDKKRVAWSYLFLADLPVLAGLGTLALFHSFTHDDDKGRENLAHYFIAGGIAFQWLASNVIFLIITWKDSIDSIVTIPGAPTPPVPAVTTTPAPATS